MALFPEDEENLGGNRPLSPSGVTAGMSADEPPASMESGAGDFQELPPTQIDQPPAQELYTPSANPSPVEQEFQRGEAAAQRQADADARAAEVERAKQEKTAKAVENKRLREQGVKLTVDENNQAVPQTRPDGTMVYEPAWTGAPAFDPDKKTWVREKRDETGKVKPIDLWDNGDIKRDDDTGELYFKHEGVRTVVGKDEGYLRKKALSGEIQTLSQAAAQRDIDAAQIRVDLKAIKEPAEEKEKELKAAQQSLAGLKPIAEKNPGWLKNPRNAEMLRSREEAVANLSKDPLLTQLQALKQKERSLDEANITEGRRKLALVNDRYALDTARNRPELVGPSPARPDETPDVTADRQTHGIGGDAYGTPSAAKEQSDFRQAMIHLDTQAEQLAPKGMVLGPDPAREGKLAAINAQRAEVVKQFSGRIAAANKFEADDLTLAKEVGRASGQIQSKSVAIDRQRAKLDDQLARGQIAPADYDSAVVGMERDYLDSIRQRDGITAQRQDLKKKTFAALQTPSEFPATLIRNGDDLDPRALDVRAAGRAAAFGTSQGQEYYDTLLEIKDAGKIKKIGGIAIAEVIRNVGGQVGMKLQDILTSDETKTLQDGLRGGLIDQQLALLHNVRGADIKSPRLDGIQPAPDAGEFWRQRFASTEAMRAFENDPARKLDEVRRKLGMRAAIREGAVTEQNIPARLSAAVFGDQKPEQLARMLVETDPEMARQLADKHGATGPLNSWDNMDVGSKQGP